MASFVRGDNVSSYKVENYLHIEKNGKYSININNTLMKKVVKSILIIK